MFWLHGVAAGFAASMALSGLGGISLGLQRIWAVLLLVYLLIWYIALWRSAERYQGAAIWKWAARSVVAFPFIGILLTVALSTGNTSGTQQVAPHAVTGNQVTQTEGQGQWVPAPPNLKPFDGKLDGEK
jgi:hypothetical protein